MTKKLAAIAITLVLVIVGFFSALNWYVKKDPKKSSKLAKQITKTSDVDPRWDVTYAPEKVNQINEIFNQHFYFIGQGKQCTAYCSYDGQYVLKFMLQKPLKLKPRFKDIPKVFPFTLFTSYKQKEKEERKEALLQSFMISYHIAPEQTGIIYVHLNPTQSLFRKPLIVDIKANPVFIDTDMTQFVLQKRARHIKPTIIDLMQSGRVAEAKNRIDQIFMLLFETAKKGIVDADTGLIRNDNIGFLDTRAIYVDTGKLRLVKDSVSKKDFVKDLRRLKPLYKWLQAYYPELAEHFAIKQQQVLDAY